MVWTVEEERRRADKLAKKKEKAVEIKKRGNRWLSRKFWVAIIPVVVALANQIFGVQVEPETLLAIFSPIYVWVLSESWIDSRKKPGIEPRKNRWLSRKFWVAIIPPVAALANQIFGIQVNPETILASFTPIYVWILGESWIDSK